jgi:histidyl-tRNA synthetase
MKPSIPKGTRDFNPEQVLKRNYIFDTVRRVFIKYGFLPIETPVMETLDTLTGKYGEEGDRLLFKVLNNGDFLADADQTALETRDSRKLVSSISKRGLRYDLTVPFARFVVMNQNELSFPFKRYQIQPVWRADRPQKGRYQEFYQCDVDVVGSESLAYEAELIQIYDEVFAQLRLPVIVKYNNRKVLAGIAEAAGISDLMVEMTVAIDKLDKIGMAGVKKELAERGIAENSIETIAQILEIKDLDALETAFAQSEVGQKGIQELKAVQAYLQGYQASNELRFDITLARGLSYYTGCIFEVQAKNVAMGSIGGGGRYDNLTGVFGLPGVSGVGVSFGAERIYDVLEELKLFPTDQANTLKVLFMAFDAKAHQYAFNALGKVRAAGINADLYPDPVKLAKQMKYANNRNVPYVVLVGDNEMASGKLALKNMQTGEQQLLSIEEIIVVLGA